MPVSWPILSVLALAFAGYWLGRRRAIACVDGDSRALHSRPGYHGWHVALFASVPALLLSTAWLLTQPLIIETRIANLIPEAAVGEGSSIDLVMTDVRRVASGLDLAVREGAMTEEEADGIRAESADIRDRLGEVGVALGGNVDSSVLHAAQRYRAQNAP